MDNRNWLDQPREIEQAEVLLHTFIDIGPIKGHGIEIRKGPGAWYLTMGNLFGSQTVKCRDAEAVIRCLAAAMKAGKEAPVPVPGECQLLPSPKEG